MCFRFLQVTVSFIRTGSLPHHDHGHVDGLEEGEPLKPGEDDVIYAMDDNLHPHDMYGGEERRLRNDGPPASGEERRKGGRS